MAGGLPTSVLIEWEIGGASGSGVWVDITSYVRFAEGIQLTFGASAEEELQPGTVEITADNFNTATGKYGVFTPWNVNSPYYPYVVKRSRIRVTVTKGATVSQRAFMRVDDIQPLNGEWTRTGQVRILASDRLSRLQQVQFRSDQVERWRNISTVTYPGNSCDMWPLSNAEDGVTRFDNVGAGPGHRYLAYLVNPLSRVGEAVASDTPGLIHEGALEFKPKDRVGPVLLCQHDVGQAQAMFWFRTTARAPAGGYTVIATGYSAAKTGLWSLRLVDNAGNTELQLYDAAGYTGTLDTWPYDGANHPVYIWSGGPGATTFYYELDGVNNQATSTQFHISEQAFMVFGGTMNPGARGNNWNCTACHITGPMVSTAAFGQQEKYGRAGQVTSVSSRFALLSSWGGVDSTSRQALGDTTRIVAQKSTIGRTYVEMLLELARTVSGAVWYDPRVSGGQVTLLVGDAFRPQTPSVTVTLEADDDLDTSTSPWLETTLGAPTRQFGTSPDGSAEYIGDESVVRQDGPELVTCAATVDDLRALCGWRVLRPRKLSITDVAVDLTTAANDLWSSVLTNLQPGMRLRVAGVDSAAYGVSYHDVHVLGWTETYYHDRVVFHFNRLEPADAPAEATFDSTEYGRFDWEEGEATLTAGITSSATSLQVSFAAMRLTTDPAAYPLDLLVGSERITCPSPPAGTTSPQTLSGVTRGVAPTTAVQHSAGEAVHIWPGPTFAP